MAEYQAVVALVNSLLHLLRLLGHSCRFDHYQPLYIFDMLQVFTLSFAAYAQNITTQKPLLRSLTKVMVLKKRKTKKILGHKNCLIKKRVLIQVNLRLRRYGASSVYWLS